MHSAIKQKGISGSEKNMSEVVKTQNYLERRRRVELLYSQKMEDEIILTS